jgi:hypothetical protein
MGIGLVLVKLLRITLGFIVWKIVEIIMLHRFFFFKRTIRALPQFLFDERNKKNTITKAPSSPRETTFSAK